MVSQKLINKRRNAANSERASSSHETLAELETSLINHSTREKRRRLRSTNYASRRALNDRNSIYALEPDFNQLPACKARLAII